MQTAPKLNISAQLEVEPQGLVDGGHTYPSCSNCRALLADIWVVRPHETEKWKLRASCPFCGDKSFIFEVQGGFHYAGYSTLVEGTEDQYVHSTVVESIEPSGDHFLLKVLKANKNAKAITRA